MGDVRFLSEEESKHDLEAVYNCLRECEADKGNAPYEIAYIVLNKAIQVVSAKQISDPRTARVSMFMLMAYAIGLCVDEETKKALAEGAHSLVGD